jgi:hypothetical protein
MAEVDLRSGTGERAGTVELDDAVFGIRPNVAVMTLLRQLSSAGAQIRCHADFDPPGILMIRHLVARVGAEPWCMGQADYLAAAGRGQVRFSGSVADTPWDPALAEAMQARGRAVFEEDVTADLLGTLPPFPAPIAEGLDIAPYPGRGVVTKPLER